ncbi:hypothetical protein LAZ67_3005620 [Cordylochernes scorpioides]|uniref:Sm domain-containing protein n=1 Tax=Cordylochernes scorpioides TaxID=51811 RepID=A0ABY6KAX0_9ARAC|nr:hypothetical protein LAZ67_3005620 [Cordylochernes scorpioides]
MGMMQKQGNWVPYELKPGNIERRICTCELLLKRQNRKGFLHRIVTGDEKWIPLRQLKAQKIPGHASTSTAKPNIHGKKLMLCIWWDQLGVIYYELLQPNETITGERYQQQSMRLSRALKIKRPLYAKRHDKVIYQHDNARPHVAKVVKETLEALQWDVLPHPLYSPDIAPSDYHMVPFDDTWPGRAALHFLRRVEKLVKLNGGRVVTGLLRGFDPFMNLVMEETVEETKGGEKHNIGMVVALHHIHTGSIFGVALDVVGPQMYRSKMSTGRVDMYVPVLSATVAAGIWWSLVHSDGRALALTR